MSRSVIPTDGLCVLLDIRQPQAYLALHPAAALAAECEVDIDWLPVVVSPLKPPSVPRERDDRGIRHRRSRAQAIAREIDTYAAVQRLEIRDYYRDDDPTVLNLAWLWLRHNHPERLPDFLAEVFRSYWAVELDISSAQAVADALERCGVPGDAMRAWCADEGPRAAAELAGELHELGVARAPCYLVGDEVFIGRQHLPMIRWILQGRSGHGPI